MFAILKSSTPAHDGRQLGKKSITRFISSLIKGKKNESKSAPQSPEKHTTKDTAQSRPTPSTQRSSRTRRSSVTLSTWRWSNYLAPTPALSYLSSLSSSTNASTQPPATPVDPSLPKGTSRPEFAFFASQHEPQSEEYLPVDPHIYDDYDFLSDPPNPSAYLDDHRYDDRTEALGLSHSSTFGPCPPPKPFKTKEAAPRLTQRPSTPEPNVVADYGQVTFCLTRDKVWTDDWKERLRTAFLDEEDFTTTAPPDLRLLHSPGDVHPRRFTHGRLPLRPICVRPRRRRAPRPSRQLLDEPTFDAFFQTFNV